MGIFSQFPFCVPSVLSFIHSSVEGNEKNQEIETEGRGGGGLVWFNHPTNRWAPPGGDIKPLPTLLYYMVGVLEHMNLYIPEIFCTYLVSQPRFSSLKSYTGKSTKESERPHPAPSLGCGETRFSHYG